MHKYRLPPALSLLIVALLLAAGACQRATPTPTATPLPSPTPTVLPATASFPLGEQALEWARRLVALSPRDTRSGNEGRAAQFLQQALADMGYRVRLHQFPVTLVQSQISLLAPQERVVEGAHMLRSGEGTVEGEVVFVGLGRREDIPKDGLAGKVALADRGDITFQEKAQAVAEAGARALLVANNQPGLFQGALQERASVPVLGISQEDGQSLKAMLAQGAVRMRVQVWSQDYPSQNVVAERVGTAPSPKVVLITAHYDTVPDVPGANDNASGVAAVLTLAQLLKERSWPFTVRLIAFGGEEEGLWGSRAYVQSLPREEHQLILGVLNLDVVGAVADLAVAGDPALIQMVSDVARAAGIPLRAIGLQEAASDHLPFLQARIPAVILTTPDFQRIHTPEDRLEFLDIESLDATIRLVEAVIQRWASGEGGG
ncbi:MAG: M20/M25/M40 family metallo-hydrolase [Dehalococcoidia bacterium]